MGRLIEFWRRRSQSLSLYQRILQQERTSEHIGYPPVAAGIEVKSLVEDKILLDVLLPHRDLLRRIDLSTETRDVFEQRYMPAIERYALTVHLLPASENHHHSGVGGLLHHGLEVGLYTLEHGRHGLYGKNFGLKEREARERYLFGCFMTGLCHDLGKAASDVRVAADSGLVWSPLTERLVEWLIQNKIKKYYVDYLPDRHKTHEQFTGSLVGHVLTADDEKFIGEMDGQVLKEMTLLLKCALSDSPFDGPKSLKSYVLQADNRSVQEDRKRSRTPADLGLARATPMIRYGWEGMRRLIKEGSWRINQPGEAVWAMGGDLFLVWPRCGIELRDHLRAEGVKGFPEDPQVIAELLLDYKMLEVSEAGSHYWRIKPDHLDSIILALRIKPEWARDLVDVMPASVEGRILADDEEGDVSDGLGGGGGGEEGKQAVVGGQSVLGGLSPRSGGKESAPATPTDTWDDLSFYTRAKWLGAGVALGFVGSWAVLFYMGKTAYPEASFPSYIWMLLDWALGEGNWTRLALIALAFLWNLAVLPVMVKAGRARVQALKDEAHRIWEGATREAQEVREKARVEAQDILAQVEEKTKEREEEARRRAEDLISQAQQEASETLASARREAQEKQNQARRKMQEMWTLLEAKAVKEGFPVDKLPELLKAVQEAEKKAAETVAQAENTAKQILSAAEEKAQAQIEEAMAEGERLAQEEIERKLGQAGLEAADIVDQARRQATDIIDQARREAADIIDQAREVKSRLEAKAEKAVEDNQAGQDRLAQNEEVGELEVVEEGTETLEEEEAERIRLLEERIIAVLTEQGEMSKRELERRINKSRQGNAWEKAIANLLADGRIVYDQERKVYVLSMAKCQQVST